MKQFSFIILVILVGLVFTPGLYPNEYGLKGGVNFANIKGEGRFQDYEIKTGFIAGVFYRFDLKGNLAIQPEVYFSMKGAKSAGEDIQTHSYNGYRYTVKSTWDFSINLNFLEVPVLLKFTFPGKKKFKPNVFVGPYAGFKLGGEVSGTSIYETTEEYDGTVNTDTWDDTVWMVASKRKVDVGVVIGGGFDIEMGSGSLVVDVRYTLGLSGIDQAYKDENNSVFTLMLGYSFKLK